MIDNSGNPPVGYNTTLPPEALRLLGPWIEAFSALNGLGAQTKIEGNVFHIHIHTAGSLLSSTRGGIDMANHNSFKGDVINSAIGDGATINARDIAAYNRSVTQANSIDSDLKEKLTQARQAAESLQISMNDKNDVIDDLGKLTDELQAPEKDVSRIQRLWNRIKDVAPTVAAILSGATSIAKLVAGG